ncbi:MAG: hypothetical protein IKH99_04400 [Prevotella sp.]|nr:hypothetical protein [Prevotella sp.]
MKKIMFNDQYGLTQAVLDEKKTMTRRIIKGDFEDIKVYSANGDWHFIAETKDGDSVEIKPTYQIGEEVAIAQEYQLFRWPALPGIDWKAIINEVTHSKGWKNKMFVKAKYMPHRIRITDIKVEKLQDISIGDCLREGITHVNWRQYLKQDIDDYSPQPYKDHELWTLPIFEESFLDSWAEQKQGEFAAKSADIAFAVLIDRINGRGTWQRNPWVFVYGFRKEE